MEALSLNSKIYVGHIRHRRFTPKENHFNYRLYMLAIDVDELNHQLKPCGVFGFSWFHPLRFVEKDYLSSEPDSLKARISNKVKELNGLSDITRIVMLVQVRCFGVYFSPANFYFCYDSNGECRQMLAEVSNTPWNQRHYYLVNLSGDKTNKKMFHVSPFMDLNMKYHWRITPPQPEHDNLLVHIENRQGDDNKSNKFFDATLTLKKKPFTKRQMLNVWLGLPVMTLKVFAGIYWQALKLFAKRVPFVSYQKAKD